ncbi:cyclic-phosphate processing receiver domain-containing protein [Paenibacillus sp. YN15]|uniref:cyclic-phosphate processing receiver domain-containing protein n=1 Tax=Paenibacillus sp. YN15 TaxID=1742774 RepID=UPI000DCF01EA|nr:cyclic-phosphate processing receiver domain-containing protein [Paenibacillus sp. YN15]RAV02406.1 cell division protein FtsJ [Paenibacillus sp. YN15]
MIHVFMDDARPRPQGFTLARTAEECLLLLELEEVDLLSLDHDMGFDQPSGLEVAKEIVRRSLFPREIYLHSSNMVARSQMFQALYPFRPEGTRIHTGPVPEELLRRIAGECG